jgi:hypothetical protein
MSRLVDSLQQDGSRFWMMVGLDCGVIKMAGTSHLNNPKTPTSTIQKSLPTHSLIRNETSFSDTPLISEFVRCIHAFRNSCHGLFFQRDYNRSMDACDFSSREFMAASGD